MCLLNNLYDYILSISHSKLDIILNIEKFGLGAILLDKLKVLDNNLYIQWKVKEIIQNSINKIIQNELIALSDACDNANIKLIHLKGLTLAEDLYKPREARIFNDIDVLVRPEEISKVLQILLNMGYTYKIGNNLADNLTDLKNLINNLDLDTEHHISELTKQIGNFNISLELHYNLRSEMGLNICIDDIIDRSTRKSFFGRPIWILDLHDQLIFLMIHFAYHYSRLLSSVPLKKVHPACEIRRIHDIALLIKKYADYINWDIIGKRAIEWNAAGPVLCSLQLLQHIYKIFIEPGIIEQLYKHINFEVFLPQRPALHKIITLNVNEILRANIEQLINDIHPKLSEDNSTIICIFRDSEKANNKVNEFLIDEFLEKPLNRFKTHVRIGYKPKSNLDCSACGRLAWDPEFLYINILVKDDVFIFNNLSGNPWDQDSVELLFYTKEPKPLKRHFILVPYIENGRNNLKILPGQEDSGIFIDFQGDFSFVEGQHYEIYVKIPWKVFGIVPYRGLRFWFDVIINDCDDVKEGRKSMMMWSSSKSFWFDVTSFGNVILD